MFVDGSNQPPLHPTESRRDGIFGESVSYDTERLVLIMTAPNMSPLQG